MKAAFLMPSVTLLVQHQTGKVLLEDTAQSFKPTSMGMLNTLMSIYHIIMLRINLFEPSKLKRLKGLDENRKSQCVFLGNNIKKNEKMYILGIN